MDNQLTLRFNGQKFQDELLDVEQFLLRNLNLSNRELGKITGLTRDQIKHRLSDQGIVRSKEQLEQIYLRNASLQTGNLNPNFRGGISRNHYHYKKIQAERYPERIKARKKVAYAVKTGKLVRSEYCELCGSKEDLQFDHRDYSKPLEVHTVCRRDNNLLKKYSWSELLTFYQNKETNHFIKI